MTVSATDPTMACLAPIEARIASTPRGPLTLDPDRSAASALSDLVFRLTDTKQRPYLAAAASAVADAQLLSVPENLLWDFDCFLASIHANACEARDYAAHLESVAATTAALMRLYGQQSTIRFRYVHDFMYGFDWARWVRREPEARAGIGPFAIEFLRRSESRGRDLLALIESNDTRYPKLGSARPRNPFSFSREPDDELRLYRLLAERGCIPVEAWRQDARLDARRDFDALREEAARSLGLRR